MNSKIAPSFKAAGSRFAVSSGCRHATAAAADVLRRGGNVVDAAIAGSAVLCVTLPHAVSIGGDLFALVKTSAQPGVASLIATGAAPRGADVPAFRKRGHAFIPVRGALSIQPPGLVAGWDALCARWASRPLAALLEPAIALAQDGFQIGGRLARLSSELASKYSSEPVWSETYLVNGQAPREGERLKQQRLAATLQLIAGGGAAAFYRGAIADDIVATVRRAGGLIEHGDLERVHAQITPPLTTRIGGVTVATQPPISQGVILLRALQMVAAEPERVRRELRQLWPRAAQALSTAFAERLGFLGDRDEGFALAQQMIEGRLPAKPLAPSVANAGTETTTISVIDADGNAAALILSIFADFGSGIVTEQTGILLNNRLSAFFLDPGHPNGLKPGRRTMHTLHNVMVCDDGRPILAGGSPGGDAQPPVNLQVLCRMLLRGEELEDAVAEPRWSLFPGTAPSDLQRQPPPTIRCEPELDGSIQNAFEQAGFRTDILATADIGSAKWVMRSDGGGLVAVSDRRRDGSVAAD